MGDQGVENDLLLKMEKRIKKKLKKGKTDEESAMGLLEIENFGRNEATGHDQRSKIEDITEMSRSHRRNKEKKANKEVKDAKVIDMEKDSRVYGEDGSGDARNQEKRKKKRSKNEVGKLEANEVLEKPVEEKVSKLKSGKAAKKKRRKQKLMEIHNDGDVERGYEDIEQGGTLDDNIDGGVTEKVKEKKRKRGRTNSKDDYCIESHGNCAGAMKSKIYDGSEENMTMENERKSKKMYESITEDLNDDFSDKVKRKKKKAIEDEHNEGDLSAPQQNILLTSHAGDVGKHKRRKKKNKKAVEDEHNEGDLAALQQNILLTSHDGDVEKHERRMKKNKTYGNEVEEANKGKNKKAKLVVDDSEHNEGDLSALQQNILLTSNDGDMEKHKRRKTKNKTYGNEVEEANKGKNKKAKLVVNDLDDPTPSKSNKKVSFSAQVEVFPLSDDSNTKEIYDEENLVRGKRFTPEENKIVKEAVYSFIQDLDLGEDGLDMVLNCKKHPELRGCWKEIGAAIPYRPYTAVYYRAQVIFRRSASRKWTQEEYDMILKHQELHGNEWKALADELGKHRWHVKDTWRRIKLRNMNKGQWTQKEYQNLFDLVNTDLQHKLSEEKRSKHGMLRDSICWTAISDRLSTRAQANCCIKWYKQLTSPMVAEGLWADTDDYRMLQKLYSMDAGCMEDVDWDTLLDHRSGDLCRKRWIQMVQHIGSYGTKSFPEHVYLLAQRYCPELLEAREIWDNKPRVP